MAKTLRMPSPAPPNMLKKTYTDSSRAKVSVGCTLHELCAEDKSKVAKLLRQVVELEKELTLTKVLGKKEKHDFQEKTQHLRQRNADMLRECNTLKAKLTHAFALLRAYQHKVKDMGTAAPAGPDLHSSNATVCIQRPQQLYCQRCGHTALLRSSDTAGTLDLNDGVRSPHLAPRVVLSADNGLQHSASTDSHDQLQSGRIQCKDGGQQAHQLASAQAGNPIPGGQEPFAELASEVLAWQLDSTASEGSAQQAADHEACKVLRFDPSLGTDGAFYFITSQSVEMQPPQAQREHGQMAASSTCQQPAHAMVQQEQQQRSGSLGVLPCQHMQLPGPEAAQQAEGALPDVASAEGARQSSSDQVADSETRDGITMVTEARNAEVQPMQVNGMAAIGEQQRGVQAQPQFPVQGGGEAGVLLRAAAAAAAGCSHELVVAAAGRACKEDDSDSRPISHEEATVQPAPATASVCFSTHATSAGSEDNLLHKLGSGSTPNPGQAEGQSGVKQIATGALQELHEELSTDRVDEDLQSLGFDSSLMDLVTEVEQMVACKQANMTDRQPAHDWRLPARSPLLHRYPSTQGAAEEEDFEENDVISLISDQEYSMH